MTNNSIFKEFKDFAIKGNVLDLAVGVIIGSSFGRIVSSFVNDIIMPPIGLLLSGVNFKDLKIPLKAAVLDPNNKIVSNAITLNIGNFLQAGFDFLITAWAIFAIIKLINHLKKKEEVKVAKEINRQEILLAEIRDLLKEKQSMAGQSTDKINTI
jgi:large conductance mechanosensitive channel